MRKKKRILGLITVLIAALVATALSACSDRAPTRPSPVFTLDKTHIELTVDGNLEQLTLTIANIDDAPVWKSSNTSIATVSVGSSENKATVRPVGKGQTVISAVAGEYIAVCTVKVNPSVSLELLTPALELLSGTASAIDVETDAETLTYTSNNTAVATVDNSGLVTGKSGGTARITVSGGGKSVVCYVTVIDPYVRLDKEKLFLTLQESENTYRLTAESNGEVEWYSENPEVATVEDGLITAVAEGNTNILASYSWAEAVCAVSVKAELIRVTLSETARVLENGKTFKLTATIMPEQTGDNANVTWSVLSGGDLVSVDEDGNVTANDEMKYGEAVVLATCVKDPDFTAECTVTVPDPRIDWIMISDKASLESALKSGNENKTMYLMNDIDLGGASVSGTLGIYNGTFYGNGYEIRNFTCGSLFGGIGSDGVIERLSIVATAANIGSHNGIFGLEMRGEVHDCIFDLTFGTAEFSAGFGRNAVGEITNTVLLLRNPSNTNNVFAGCVQGGGTWKNVYYVVYDGSVNAGGPVQKTNEQIRAASLYSGFDEEIWIIEDGETPRLANDDNIGIRVSLNAEQADVYVGESGTLIATVKPSGLSVADKAVVWESSDEKILTVKDGVIRGVKAGTATVTVKSAVDPEKTATCTVTVKAIEILIDTAVTELRTNGSKQLSATVNHGGFEWESSDNAVATVGSDGLVTAISEGIVTITVRSLLDPAATDAVTIEVKHNIEISVVLSNTTLTLDRGDSSTIIATVVNSDGGVQWSSSDGTVASVDENGKVTTYGVDGTAVITATANESDGDGGYAQASCTVTVELVPVTVTPSGETEFEIALGSTLDVSKLATASKGGLTVSIVDGDDFVSLTNGVVTAVADGTATVRIASNVSYADYDAPYIEISITVYTPSVEIKMGATRYSTGLTSTTLRVMLDPMPESAAAGDIVWISSDENVISSISGGVASGAYTATFTPKKYGFAEITASYVCGDRTYTATCEVEVFDPKGAIAVSTVNGLKSALSNTNGNFYLACDIDFGDTVYTTSFAGTVVSVTLDGRGYTLKNIKTDFSANEIGFINMLDGLTVLRNIAFTGFNINGTESFMYGGLIGSITANASISNCYFEGVISARRANEHYVGTIGTIHTPTSKIENCVFNVGFGAAALNGSNANANPKVIAGRWFNGTITALVNATAFGGDKILVAPLNGQEKLADAIKTEEALKSSSTYDGSWSAWVIENGELPRIRTGWDE